MVTLSSNHTCMHDRVFMTICFISINEIKRQKRHFLYQTGQSVCRPLTFQSNDCIHSNLRFRIVTLGIVSWIEIEPKGKFVLSSDWPAIICHQMVKFSSDTLKLWRSGKLARSFRALAWAAANTPSEYQIIKIITKNNDAFLVFQRNVWNQDWPCSGGYGCSIMLPHPLLSTFYPKIMDWEEI